LLFNNFHFTVRHAKRLSTGVAGPKLDGRNRGIYPIFDKIARELKLNPEASTEIPRLMVLPVEMEITPNIALNFHPIFTNPSPIRSMETLSV